MLSSLAINEGYHNACTNSWSCLFTPSHHNPTIMWVTLLFLCASATSCTLVSFSDNCWYSIPLTSSFGDPYDVYFWSFQGSSDLSALSEEGVAQALRCKQALTKLKFSSCFASPISRAKVSALTTELYQLTTCKYFMWISLTANSGLWMKSQPCLSADFA